MSGILWCCHSYQNGWLSPVTTNSSPPEARAFPHPRSKLIKLVGAFASWWRIIRRVYVCARACAPWRDAACCYRSSRCRRLQKSIQYTAQLFVLGRTCIHRLLCCIQSNFVFKNLCILTQGLRYGSINGIRQYSSLKLRVRNAEEQHILLPPKVFY